MCLDTAETLAILKLEGTGMHVCAQVCMCVFYIWHVCTHV